MAKKNNILVIIVAYNSMKWAERCYSSLQASSVPCDVLTVDNGSTDGTQDFIRTHHPEVELVESDSNLGFGRANNIGLQRVLDEGYDYAYLLNQDAWVMPDTFGNLIAVSKKHPDYGILSPMQMKAGCQHLDTNFITHVIGKHQVKAPFFSEDMFFSRQEDVYDVTAVMAAHWLITHRCIEQVGGFSPTFPHYGEDDNYIQRALYWKLGVGIVPTAKAVHDRSNPVWDAEKLLYIDTYIRILKSASNPLGKKSLDHEISEKFRKALKTRNKPLLRYAVRLFRERKDIKRNFECSLQPKAFLH